jgi:hypothetical protein
MLHFGRILTILLHFLVRAPDRLYFTTLHQYSMCTLSSKKEPIPFLKFRFEEDDKGFSKRFSYCKNYDFVS